MSRYVIQKGKEVAIYEPPPLFYFSNGGSKEKS